MARRRARSNRGNRLSPFVALLWTVLNSKAYINLPPSAAKALPYFIGKTRSSYKDPGLTDITFHFPYSEGKKLGFASATFSKAIKNLVSHGFIDPAEKGGLRGDGRSYNYFKLSRRWEKFGTHEFEKMEWECFIPKPR